MRRWPVTPALLDRRLFWRTPLLFLLALLTGLGSGQPLDGQSLPPPGRPEAGDVMVVLGDSIAVGVGATAPSQRGMAATLASWLNRVATGRPVVLRNLAISGETSQSLIDGGQLARVEELLRQARTDGRRVSPVLLSLGGNDLIRVEAAGPEARRQALARFEGNLATILDRLIDGLTIDQKRQGAVVLMTVYSPRGGDAAVVGSDAWWIEEFNRVIRSAATGRSLLLADIWALIAGQEAALTRIGVGDVHPNNAGHQAIAEAIWRILRYDQGAPLIELLAPAAGELPRPVPTVRARVDDTVGVARVELWVDGRRVKELIWLPEHGVYAGTWDGRMSPVGAHQLEVRAFDSAENMARVTREVIVRSYP